MYKHYLKNRNTEMVSSYREIINALQLKSKELKRDLSEQEEISVLKNLRKKSLDAIRIFTENNRVADKDILFISVLEEYLPKEMNEEETRGLIMSFGTFEVKEVMQKLKDYPNVNKKLALEILKEVN